MSARETPMVLWYWHQIGGALIEEFPVVRAAAGQGRRYLDAVIVLGRERERLPPRTELPLDDQDVVVIQAKFTRLGMSLMGQTVFSRDLVYAISSPRSVRSMSGGGHNGCVLGGTAMPYLNGDQLAAIFLSSERAYDKPPWIDTYATAIGQWKPALAPDEAVALAHKAYVLQGWANPKIAAGLDVLLGPMPAL